MIYSDGGPRPIVRFEMRDLAMNELKGYTYGNDVGSSYGNGTGPYVVIDGNGKVIDSFPAEGNDGRFGVLVYAYCWN